MIDQRENLTFFGCLGSTLRKKVFSVKLKQCALCQVPFERNFVVIAMKGKIE
jgi:hypothetical protein